MHLTKALGRQSNSSDMKCGCGELACRWRSIPEVMEWVSAAKGSVSSWAAFWRTDCFTCRIGYVYKVSLAWRDTKQIAQLTENWTLLYIDILLVKSFTTLCRLVCEVIECDICIVLTWVGQALLLGYAVATELDGLWCWPVWESYYLSTTHFICNSLWFLPRSWWLEKQWKMGRKHLQVSFDGILPPENWAYTSWWCPWVVRDLLLTHWIWPYIEPLLTLGC